MKKRIIALLLSLVMLTSLLTPTALATEGQEPETTQEEVVKSNENERTDLNGATENGDAKDENQDPQQPTTGDEEQPTGQDEPKNEDETKGEDGQPGEEPKQPEQPGDDQPTEPEQGEETETPEEPEETEFDAGAVYAQLMACGTVKEMDAIAAELTEEQIAQFSDDQLAAIEALYAELKGEEPEEPDYGFTEEEWATFTQGFYVDGELLYGEELADALFTMTDHAFRLAVNQMDIKQAGSLENVVDEEQGRLVSDAMCHGGFQVPEMREDWEEPEEESAAPALKAIFGVLAGVLAASNQPVWPTEGSIKLDKDAKAVEGAENLWEVTLSIKGKNFKTTSDVVLVIDCSGSMKGAKLTNTRKAAKAFGEKLLTENSTTRIAIVTYIDEATAYNNGHFYTARELDAFKTAVDNATYANGGTNQQAGIHVAQQLLQSAASTGKQKNIVILSDGEATYSYPFVGGNANIGCGQFFAHWFSGNPKVTKWPTAATPDYKKAIGSGNDFDLDDGNIIWDCTCEHNRTTRKQYGSFYYDASGNFICSNGAKASDNGVATIWEANQAKAAGTTIYSVALQAGTNGENTLKSCASDPAKGYFTISDSDNVESKLTNAFQAIAGSIAIAASQGTVADTMGKHVDLSFSGAAPIITTDLAVYEAGNADVYISQGTATYDTGTHKINWNVGNVNEGTDPTMRYKVKIRDDYSPGSGEVLDTNESAIFRYKNYQDEVTEATFPVPRVTVGGGMILVHYYLVNESGKPINEKGQLVGDKKLAMEVKPAEYFAVDGSTALVYNKPYTVPKVDLADYIYYGRYNLNDDPLTEGDTATVTLTAANSNQHVWFAYQEKPKTAAYTFQFLEKGTEAKLAEPITGTATIGSTETRAAKDIPGYTCVDPDSKRGSITIDQDASKNVFTFWYGENTVTINYQVAPASDGMGTVVPETEGEVKVFTGKVNGSVPTPKDNYYRFVGWYKDAACTQPVNAAWVNADNKLTPQKSASLGGKLAYEAATYYAKFELALFDLTIKKSGWQDIDENQSFIFKIRGNDGYSAEVTVLENGQVTIKGLKVGVKYTVTEDQNWSWRYTTTESYTVESTTEKTKEVTFKNSRPKTLWLNGCSWAVNNWNNTEATKSPATPGKTN